MCISSVICTTAIAVQATVKRIMSEAQRAGVSQITQVIADGGSSFVELADPLAPRTRQHVAGVSTVGKKKMSAGR